MPENNPSKLVSRSEFLSYMEVPEGTFALMGEGFTNLSEAKNPKEYSRQYVHEKTERTDVTGYATSVAYSVDTYTNNPVIAKIREVHDRELIGTDAQVNIVSVNVFDENKAFKRRYAIIPDSKGDGTDALVYSGNFKAVGDIVEGTFADGKFTEAAPSA